MKAGSNLNHILIFIFGILITILFILTTVSFMSLFGGGMLSVFESLWSEARDNREDAISGFSITDLRYAYRISNYRMVEVLEIHHVREEEEVAVYSVAGYESFSELMSDTISVVCVKVVSVNSYYIEGGSGSEPYITTVYTLEVTDLLRGDEVGEIIKIEIKGQGYDFEEETMYKVKFLPVFEPGEEWILFINGSNQPSEVLKQIKSYEDIDTLFTFIYLLKVVDGKVYSLDFVTDMPVKEGLSINGMSMDEFRNLILKS